MRPSAILLGLPLGLALWAGSLWWSPPYGVSLRLEPRPGVPALKAAPDVWRLEVTQTFPALEGLAVGDRVQFDRYGVLAPTRGSVQCVPVLALDRGPGQAGPVQLTPLGGRLTHAGHVQITRVPAGAPGCEFPARLEPVVSLHP